MWEMVKVWLSDPVNLVVAAALVALLYAAREPAHRLIRNLFMFAGRAGRVGHRWLMMAAGGSNRARDQLIAALPEHERRNASPGTRFAFALVLTLAVGIAGWLNFALLERPMMEILGDSYRVMGVPVYRLAALAIIVLEVAVGMVLLEALGGTTMFPALEQLERKRALRITVVIVLATALLVLAVIEAALALTRDEISRLERELMGTLSGAPPSPTAQNVGELARYAQAAFGFVIPFALAFLGFAIEMLIRNGRIVLQTIVTQLLLALGFLARLVAHLAQGLTQLMVALYDVLIFLPLFIEHVVRRVRKQP